MLSSAFLHSESKQFNKIIDEYAAEVDQKYNLQKTVSFKLNGSSIREISLFFNSNYPEKSDEAVDLCLDVAKMLLGKINNDPFLKTELEPYPFTIDQLDIIIFFRKNGEYAPWPNVAQVELHKGEVTLYKFENKDFIEVETRDIHHSFI